MGTGDGLFAYRCARDNPRKFYVGIDANSRPLEKISEKIYRKHAKGGLANLVFVQAAVEELPSELDHIADELHVNLPWGSLLAAIAGTNSTGLNNLRRICATGATLRVTVALDIERDATTIQRLQLPVFSPEFVFGALKAIYRDAGFEVVERNLCADSAPSELQTSWAKRLRLETNRQVVSIVARAITAG